MKCPKSSNSAKLLYQNTSMNFQEIKHNSLSEAHFQKTIDRIQFFHQENVVNPEAASVVTFEDAEDWDQFLSQLHS